MRGRRGVGGLSNTPGGAGPEHTLINSGGIKEEKVRAIAGGAMGLQWMDSSIATKMSDRQFIQ